MKLLGNLLREAYCALVDSWIIFGCLRLVTQHQEVRDATFNVGSCHLGGNGYINDYPTGRFLRDAKLYEIGAGTSEIRRWLIGEKLNSEFL